MFKKILSVLSPGFPRLKKDDKVIGILQNYINMSVGRPPYYIYKHAIDRYFDLSKVYNALTFGCGAGNEEVDLVLKGWNVKSIDKNSLSNEIIKERIKGLYGKFIFQKGEFFDIEMNGEYDLVMALYALPFGKKDQLEPLLKKINQHTKSGSVFVANFFGNDDSAVKDGLAYGITEEEMMTLFTGNNFKIDFYLNRKYHQVDYTGVKAHWDLLEVIAVKL